MFIGACAGSTGGGLKVSRLIILFKSSFSEVSRFIHPKSVRSVTIDKKKVDDQVVRQAKSYFAIYILIYAVSCLIISLNDFDFSTTMSSVAAALNNIGPGFELVGPKGNYAMFSPLSKVVLIFDMLAGRLELFPMLIIFSPATIKETVNAVKRRKIWKKKPHRI